MAESCSHSDPAGDWRINNCHPERSEGSRCGRAKSFAALKMIVNPDSYWFANPSRPLKKVWEASPDADETSKNPQNRRLETPPTVQVRGMARATCRLRSAYTLLEVILTLALTTVILGLIATAIHVHLGVVDKSRGQVEEAQLARVLLQRIADDLRNAIPYTPPSSSASAGSQSSSGMPTSSDSSASSDPSASSESSTAGTSTGGGICGSLRCLQVDTSRRPRLSRLALMMSTADNSQLPPLSDLWTVTYSLGNPGTVSPTEQGDSAPDAQGGLYRRELERSQFVWAMRQGLSDVLNQATNLLAPEVVDMQFTYYDGLTTSDTWDSTQQGKLPTAVKVAIAIRRPARTVAGGRCASHGRYFALCDLRHAGGDPELEGRAEPNRVAGIVAGFTNEYAVAVAIDLHAK